MPVRPRKPNEIVQQLMPLLLLGVGLIGTNRLFTYVDDEVWSLDGVSQSVRTLFARALSGDGPHEIPPLYGVVLHFWLYATAGNFEYLRIPAILFFLTGLFLLGRAARQIGGSGSAPAVIWLGVLWPFGFHYGRLAAPDAFVFFLVAGLTLAYLRFREEHDFARSAALFLFGAALLWTTLFGWAVLLCLAMDQLFRYRAAESTVPIRIMVRTVILWVAAFVPILRPSYRGFVAGVNVHHRFAAVITNCALQVYNLFVSESVAPWHWQLSIPAGLAVLVCVILVFINQTGPSRRFLVFSAVLTLFMAVTGTLLAQRMMILAPWVMLSVAGAIGSIKIRWARPVLALALLIVGGIGWAGIFSRSYYSAPEFLDPWAQLAADAADKIHAGAAVVSNSRPFFFYLTYAFRFPTGAAEAKFEGLLPDTARRPDVTTPEHWLSSGHPISPTMLWIRGTAYQQAEGPMDDAAHELDQSCGSRTSRLSARDQGYGWKQKFLPEAVGPIWRIEVREYDCVSSNSREIFRIPAP